MNSVIPELPQASSDLFPSFPRNEEQAWEPSPLTSQSLTASIYLEYTNTDLTYPPLCRPSKESKTCRCSSFSLRALISIDYTISFLSPSALLYNSRIPLLLLSKIHSPFFLALTKPGPPLRTGFSFCPNEQWLMCLPQPSQCWA